MGKFVPEDVAAAVLERFMEKGVILGYMHAKKNCELDCAGIDFLVFLPNGLCLPLQIKNCKKRIREHFIKHPCVKYILIIDHSSEKLAYHRLRRILHRLKAWRLQGDQP